MWICAAARFTRTRESAVELGLVRKDQMHRSNDPGFSGGPSWSGSRIYANGDTFLPSAVDFSARSAWSLHSHQNAILYALLCDAARGDDGDGPWQMPEGLLLDAPEQCRDRYQPGELFAFGAMLIEFDPERASGDCGCSAMG